MGFSKGLDFSKIRKITDFNDLSGKGIVYKNTDTGSRSTIKEESTTRDSISVSQKEIIANCFLQDDNWDYDYHMGRMTDSKLPIIKWNTWETHRRSFTYIVQLDNPSAMAEQWVNKTEPIKYYIELLEAA